MDILDLLNRSDFFKGISEESKRALASISLPKTINKKESLFLEGDRGHSIFLLASGSVQLFKSTPNGKEVVIKIIRPAELFAEVILFEKDAYPVSAVAIRKSIVYVMSKPRFYALLATETFRNDFIRMLMKKQRYLAERILVLAAYDVEQRFFRFLLQQFGRKEEYVVPLSKKDFAAAIGTIPETLSRLLLRLKKEGKAVWEKNVIRLRKGFWERASEYKEGT